MSLSPVLLVIFKEKEASFNGQVENSEIAETTEITEIAVVQKNYKFCQQKIKKDKHKSEFDKVWEKKL